MLNVPLTKILNTFGREDIIIPLPREAGLDEAFRSEALHCFDDFEVGDVEVFVFRCVVVFFSYEDALCANLSMFILDG